MNITKFGFEQEFFFTKGGQFVFLESNTHLLDHCGYLVEARAEAHSDPLSAAKLLEVAQIKLTKAMAGYELLLADTADVPKEHQRLCLRKFGKNPAQSYFASGRVYMSNRPRAGLHIHLGTALVKNCYNQDGDPYEFKYAPMMNFARVIWLMDRAFREEIKKAKRIPGEYELKDHGFEYRSLPATVNISKVVDVLHQILKD